jgi:hypothetical protein
VRCISGEVEGRSSGLRCQHVRLSLMDDTLDVVQRGSQTAAAIAVNKFEARLAAGSDRLAQLFRKDQGLAAETETLDKAHCQITFLNPARRGDQLVARAHERIRAGRSGIYD